MYQLPEKDIESQIDANIASLPTLIETMTVLESSE